MDRLRNSSEPSSATSPRAGIPQDIVSGGVLLAAAVAYGVGGLEIPAQPAEPGPGFLPVILAVLLGALALAVLVGGLRSSGRAEPPAAGKSSTTSPAEARGPWLAGLATILYAALFQPLGFALSTLVYSAVLTGLFTDEWKHRLGVPVLVTAALYLFFSVALGVRLPPGLLR
ncbi:MAG: tripartite tricarboxylate transporter TctB family protein [Gemmatimonadota bacterium]